MIIILSLPSLPSCFTKEIKKSEVIIHDQVVEENNNDNNTIKTFDSNIRPCYYWELDEEKTTNVN